MNDLSVNDLSVNDPSVNDPSVNDPSVNDPSVNDPDSETDAEFVRACALGALTEQVPTRVVVEGIPLAIVRSEGEVYAVHDVCSHQNIPLSEGEVEDVTIECWLHGSRFDLRTGKPSGPPATQPVPVYPVKVDGEDVLVSLTPRHP